VFTLVSISKVSTNFFNTSVVSWIQEFVRGFCYSFSVFSLFSVPFAILRLNKCRRHPATTNDTFALPQQTQASNFFQLVKQFSRHLSVYSGF